MKCNHCGYENDLAFTFCPSCGNLSQPQTYAAPSTAVAVSGSASARILPALKDNLFMVICILLSANCALGLMGGQLQILNILMTIFLWMTYSKSRKDIADASHLRKVSGTVFANYVIIYVLAGAVVLLGIGISAVIDMIASSPEILEEMLFEFGAMDPEMMEILDELDGIMGFFAAGYGSAIMIGCIIAAAIIAVVNAFSMRYIHKFTQSAYKSLQTGNLELKRLGATKGWLITFAVFSGLSAFSDLGIDMLYAFAEGCMCALYIVAVIWIKKYFPAEK